MCASDNDCSVSDNDCRACDDNDCRTDYYYDCRACDDNDCRTDYYYYDFCACDDDFCACDDDDFCACDDDDFCACDNDDNCSVGNQVGSPGPSGGTIIFVDESRPEGSRYLEVACAGWSDGTCGGDDLTDPTVEWGCYATLISGADGTAIGTSEQNTTDIVTGCSTAGIAARLANDLTLGGETDWFLPSKYELNQLCRYAWNLTFSQTTDTCTGMTDSIRTGFSYGSYWSSSENADIYAWRQSFSSGGQSFTFKSGTYYVRPVRAF